MNSLDKRMEKLGIKANADTNKDSRKELLAEVTKANTVAQLKAVVLKLVQILDK